MRKHEGSVHGRREISRTTSAELTREGHIAMLMERAEKTKKDHG